MGYKFLEHATDAFIEIKAKDLKEAFLLAANSVIETTLDQEKVEEKQSKDFVAKGKDLRYLLFNWLEELTFVLICIVNRCYERATKSRKSNLFTSG